MSPNSSIARDTFYCVIPEMSAHFTKMQHSLMSSCCFVHEAKSPRQYVLGDVTSLMSGEHVDCGCAVTPTFRVALLACLGQHTMLRDTAAKVIPASRSTGTHHCRFFRQLVAAHCDLFAAIWERSWKRTCWDVVLLPVTYSNEYNDLCYKNKGTPSDLCHRIGNQMKRWPWDLNKQHTHTRRRWLMDCVQLRENLNSNCRFCCILS